jgi:hypothetical protein
MAIQSPLGNRATSILDFIGNAFGMNDEEEKRRQAGVVVGAPIQQPSLQVGPMQFGEPQSMEQLQVQQQMQEQNARMPQIGQQTAVNLPDLGTKETELMAADAAVRQMAAGGDQDPGFMDKVKNYFGDEGNMLRLAMAFNTMRMNPDQQLAAYAAKRLETIQKGKLAEGGAKAIAQQLFKMGPEYKDYAIQALRNPSMASAIYEQVIQKDLAPGGGDKVSGVQQTADGKQFITITPAKGGKPRIEWLGTTGETAASRNTAELDAQKWKISIDKSEKAMEKADSLYSKIGLYDDAIKVAREANARGEEVGGIFRSRLPAFTEQQALFNSIKNQLGITVINSATFGALSADELKLALSTEIDSNLKGDALIRYMERKRDASLKLYRAMAEEAEMLSTMQWDDYVSDRNKRREENLKYMDMKAPDYLDDQAKKLWEKMSPLERKQFIEAGKS